MFAIMSEMLLVREVTIERVPRDTVRIAKHSRVMNSGPCVPFDIETEDVRGERFITHGGKMVCIGMTNDVREAIGLPCGIFERQQNEIRTLERQVAEMSQRADSTVRKLRSLSWWQRCKVLFGADPMRFCV